jgi:hypothetical protein
MGNSARAFNLISIIFVVLTILVIVVVGVRFAAGPVQKAETAEPLPQVILLPTLTPSDTPTSTLPPTFTFTPTNTLTPTDSPTPSPTITLSPTITDTPAPTFTASATFTPSVSPTSTPTETPTGPSATPPPTLSPFLFDLPPGQDVVYTKNFANSAGCAWEGIGGQVFDTNGAPLNGLRLHVFGTNIDTVAESGSNSLYGGAGWEVPVDNKINSSQYFVELQSAAGTVISPRITVTFPSNCDQNLAMVYFKQARER